MRHRFLYMVLLLLGTVPMRAELVPLDNPQSGATGVAPLFFSPNAFPIPDMLDGRTQGKLRVEAAGDVYIGMQGDYTEDIFARIYIPLFTDRVNLTVWMPIMEWYQLSDERRSFCRIADSTLTSGHEAGDVYVSADIHLLKQRKICPDIAFRAALKTASGGGFSKARYYDSPGYFFDLAIGKSMYILSDGGVSGLPQDKQLVELRLSGSVGFLCWQTANGRQNDAFMYGLQLLVAHRYVSLRTTWGGYMGWEKYGDRPMSLKVQASGHIRGFEPYILYQYGIKDYPFHQVRVGLAYNVDILKRKEAKK